MAWPGATISTANVDAGTDSPSSARADIKQCIEAVNTVIGARGQPEGIPSTDSTGKVPPAQGGLPSGVILDYAGSTAPTGYLFCDGAAVSRTTYANLFAAIGSNYGAGDGSTTFNVPDFRGRVAAGRDDMGGTNANRLTVVLTGNTTSGSASVTALSSTANLAVGMKVFGTGIPAGATIATITSGTAITLSANATANGTGVSLRFGLVDGITLGNAGGDDTHTLITGQLASHTHTYDNAGNSHYELRATGGSLALGAGGTLLATTDTGVSAAGGGQAHPNVQPTLICNKIIKT